jgi:hypothetical protein
MADSGVVIPSEISEVIEERVVLWQQLEKSQNQFRKIEKLASPVASSTPTQIASELTSDGTPPAEITVALHNLKEELARIDEAEDDIEEYQNEIEEIQRLWTIVIVTIVIAMIIGLWLLSGALA